MKKLTVPVARALAEQVVSRIKAKRKAEIKAAETAYKSLKEYKELVKKVKALDKAEEEVQRAKDALKEKAVFGKVYPTGSSYSRNSDGIRGLEFGHEGGTLNVDDIKNQILIQDFVSEEGETAEQLIDRLVAQLS